MFDFAFVAHSQPQVSFFVFFVVNYWFSLKSAVFV